MQHMLRLRKSHTLVRSASGRSLTQTHGLRALSSRAISDGPATDVRTEASFLEIRAGKILAVAQHPTLPTIFVESIDLGESGGPRTICSGLVGFLTAEDLLGKTCIVLANLKSRDLAGTPSDGMVLCASSADPKSVRLVSPPEGTSPGELIKLTGHASDPAPPGNRSAKAWKKVCGSFEMVNGVAWFTGDHPSPLNTALGPCTSAISNGPIS